MNADSIDYAQQFEDSLGWRKDDWIERLAEIGGYSSVGLFGTEGQNPAFFGRYIDRNHDRGSLDAIALSILLLWHEAVYCYVLEQFQASILTCGAVVERTLKFSYELKVGSLPGERWTLGRTIQECGKEGILDEGALSLAEQVNVPRNDRAHANLERKDSLRANMGGNRGIKTLTSAAYLIFPFQQDARNVLDLTLEFLKRTHSALDQ